MARLFETMKQCRGCGALEFAGVIDLGSQALGGTFPHAGEQDPPVAPLEVVRCTSCNLVQLRHSVDPSNLYTDGYGYRSGINATMRNHLAALVGRLVDTVPFKPGDTVIDIGSNDGTLLSNYPAETRKIGVDPLANKFAEFYPPNTDLVAGFFSRELVAQVLQGRKASAVTSIAMFYDLEDPRQFVADVAAVLAPDGVWVLELSYLPSMLARNSYDTICHEHLEYYSLAQIEQLAASGGLRAFDVSINDINGGSFRVFLCHAGAGYADTPAVVGMRQSEAALALSDRAPYDEFRERCIAMGQELRSFISDEVAKGRRIHVYGASTKGNTILQFCGLDASLIEAAAERNPDKWGARTPATGIPIISESASRDAKPDYYLVLPWHFKDEFLKREAEFREKGGRFIFPLPELQIL